MNKDYFEVVIGPKGFEEEVFCPLCNDERIIKGQCVKFDETKCPYFFGIEVVKKDGVMRTILKCNHHDIESCNPYSDIDL